MKRKEIAPSSSSFPSSSSSRSRKKQRGNGAGRQQRRNAFEAGGNDVFLNDEPFLPPSTSCCICNQAEDEELTILCDGPGCNKETHMYCLQPPLYEVPAGEWFCDTCDPLGTTLHLQHYLNHHRDIKKLLLSQEGGGEGVFGGDLLLPSLAQWLLCPTPSHLPLSSSPVLSSLSIPPCEFPSSSSSSSASLLGCKVKVFNPIDERFHVGRIIAAERPADREEEDGGWRHLLQFKRSVHHHPNPLIPSSNPPPSFPFSLAVAWTVAMLR